MINTYYLMKDGEQIGPFSLYELTNMDLTWDDMVLSPLNPEWQHAADLPELAQYFQRKGIYFPTLDNLANFWWRLLAYVIDSIFLGVLIGIVSSVYPAMKYMLDHVNDGMNRWYLNLICFSLYVVYHTVCEASTMHGSIGKKILNMAVVDANGAGLSFFNALGRNAGKFLSSLVCCVGYVMIFWDEHRQAWHDKLARTYVVKKG